MNLTPRSKQIVAAKSAGEGLAKVGSRFRRATKLGYKSSEAGSRLMKLIKAGSRAA